MTFKPLYRGTRKELLAEEGKALRWFHTQVSKGLTYDTALKLGDADIRHVIDRSWGGYHSPHKTEHTDFFHLFRMPQPGTTYGEKRFTIRKDGTINVVGAAECAVAAIRRTEDKRERRRVFTHNKKLWSDIYAEENPREKGDALGMSIKMSQYEPGMMDVQTREDPWDFVCRRQIPIYELEAFIEFAKTTRSFLTDNF